MAVEKPYDLKSMKRIFTLLLILCFGTQLMAQDYWKTYREFDGLASRLVNSISVHNKVIYAATESGLSVIENDVIINYDTSNSSIPSQRISLVKNFLDTIWLATDSGLTEFINGSMRHFSDTNGLLNNDIQDMELDSKGNLWIASFDGLTKFDGDTFIHETGRKIFNIAINKGDSVYANVGFESIVNVASPVTAELYDGANWTVLRDTSLNPFISKANFVNLNDTLVGILSNEGRVFQVDSIFNLNESQLPSEPINVSFLSDMKMDSRGNIWYSFAPSQFPTFVEAGMFRFDGSNYDFFSAGLPAGRVYDIETEGNVVYIATENGVAFAVDSIKPVKSSTFLETNSLRVRINADGTLFRSDDNANNSNGFNYPKGTNKNMVYTSGLWMGEESDSADKKLAIQTFSRGDFSIGTINNNGNTVGGTMIEITNAEIDFHLANYRMANYQMPESKKEWPGNGRADFEEAPNQAPFVDANRNGCYDPEQGDYPYIIGDKAVYLVINDSGEPNTGQPVSNLNTEVQILAYVFDQPNIPYLDQTLFVRYIINNRSQKDYKDLKTGFYYDFDLGGFLDDYFGSDPGSDIFYTYNADGDDQGFSGNAGYGAVIPSLGIKMINTQLDGFMGYKSNNPNSRITDPRTPGHYFNALNYLWNDATPMTQFGDRYNPSLSNTTNFMYNGDVFDPNEWSALYPGPGLGAASPTDIRGVGIAEAFDLKPNEKYVIDIALGVGLDSSNTNYLDNVTLMIDNLNRAANYQKSLVSILPEVTYASCITGIGDFKELDDERSQIALFPNPTNGEINVLAKENLERIEIYNAQGQLVLSILSEQQAMTQKISLPRSLPNGIYVVQALVVSGIIYSEKLMLSKN